MNQCKNQTWIDHIATYKIMRQEETAEAMKPGSKSLLKTINGLLELANKMGKIRVNETRGFFRVDFFS